MPVGTPKPRINGVIWFYVVVFCLGAIFTFVLFKSKSSLNSNSLWNFSGSYEYGYSRDFYLRNFGSGEDVVLEKPVKIRNFDLLINEFEAQPEDFKNKTII
jgi:hypothetical protein